MIVMPSGFALGAEPTAREIEALSLPAFVEPSTLEDGTAARSKKRVRHLPVSCGKAEQQEGS